MADFLADSAADFGGLTGRFSSGIAADLFFGVADFAPDFAADFANGMHDPNLQPQKFRRTIPHFCGRF